VHPHPGFMVVEGIAARRQALPKPLLALSLSLSLFLPPTATGS
jgi:hypothetical protein